MSTCFHLILQLMRVGMEVEPAFSAKAN